MSGSIPSPTNHLAAADEVVAVGVVVVVAAAGVVTVAAAGVVTVAAAAVGVGLVW